MYPKDAFGLAVLIAAFLLFVTKLHVKKLRKELVGIFQILSIDAVFYLWHFNFTLNQSYFFQCAKMLADSSFCDRQLLMNVTEVARFLFCKEFKNSYSRRMSKSLGKSGYCLSFNTVFLFVHNNM